VTLAPAAAPVLACAEAIERLLDEVSHVDPVFMSTTDKAAALLALTRAEARLGELRGRVLAVANDVAEAAGARDAAAWLAHRARLDPGQARHELRLARAIGESWLRVGSALRDGAITADQAGAVVRGLERLPEDLETDVIAGCEQRLVEEAGRFGPRELRILARRVVEVVAPDVADEHERRALEREEAHASSVTRVSTRRRGDGTTDIRIRAADAVADRFLTYLHAIASPRRPDGRVAVNPDDRRPYPQRLGHAFGTLLEAMDPRRLPLQGGDATTVVVTIDHETLLRRLHESGVALLGDEPISAAEARRLACQAKIIPVVLGGDSVPLDQGRGSRFFKGPRRQTLAALQPCCRAEGCTIPAEWCEAHHGAKRWVDGGTTDLSDAVLLCPFHHHRAHDHRYDLTRLPDGRVRFSLRT
jgi:hypothetical protein